MVLAAAKDTDIKLYVSTFYQEGGAPAFDDGIKRFTSTATPLPRMQTAATTPSRLSPQWATTLTMSRLRP